MNVTPEAEPPPLTTTTPIRSPPGSHDYLFVVGFFFTALLLFTITYFSHVCKRSQPPPPPPDDEGDNNHLIRLSRGLDDNVLVTIPTSVYSETMMSQRFDAGINNVGNGSGCSICLVDYVATDVVRILPECGHLFHVGCIDTWLKAHPTCPVCRSLPLAGSNGKDSSQ